jgi:hypothetical protein
MIACENTLRFLRRALFSIALASLVLCGIAGLSARPQTLTTMKRRSAHTRFQIRWSSTTANKSGPPLSD